MSKLRLALMLAAAATAVLVLVEAGGVAETTRAWRRSPRDDTQRMMSQETAMSPESMNAWVDTLVNSNDCTYNRTRLEQLLLLNHGASEHSSSSSSSSSSAEKNLSLNEDYLTSQLMTRLSDCYEERATALFQTQNEELAFQAELRTSLSSQLENKTCADPTMETSEPLYTTEWEDYHVQILHDRPSSQIHVIEHFISPEECAAIQDAAAKKLHRGTVADGKGGHQLSQARKAWQAGVSYRHREQDDPIRQVMQRIYDYTNHAVGYNISLEGQEDLMSIQYFGKNASDTDKAQEFDAQAPDQYRPHCDGECDGLPHKEGGRVATMVMYCDVPQVGGGTNFQHSNVFVKPSLGAAAFFSYMNPKTHHQEEGFTSHSGCPVLEGTKRIAVHWMRIGVDEKSPWNSFNTLTVKEEED